MTSEVDKKFRVNGTYVSEEDFNAAVERSANGTNSEYDAVEITDQHIDETIWSDEHHYKWYDLIAKEQEYVPSEPCEVVEPFDDFRQEADDFISTYGDRKHVKIKIDSNQMFVCSDGAKETMTIENVSEYYHEHVQKED